MGLFKSNVKKISPEDAKTMMAEGDVTLLDVRRKEEYQSGHIPGAELLTLDTIGKETAEAVIPNKDTAVVMYCLSGGRSRSAAAKLSKLGYQKVYDLGGIRAWPYEIEA